MEAAIKVLAVIVALDGIAIVWALQRLESAIRNSRPE